VTSNATKDRVYATTMSEPPRVFTWGVDQDYHFTHLSTVNISECIPAAASWDNFIKFIASSACYISDDGQYSFSAGGPTVQINSLGNDGVIGNQTLELYLIPIEDIDSVDKTRDAVVSH
jgi:carboxy-cis,cis-muconate cyclase